MVNRWAGGVKSDIAFIPYENIVSIRISHGVLFSSLFIRLKGAGKDVGATFGSERDEGEVNGLNRNDAEVLFREINSVLHNNAINSARQKYHTYSNVTNNVYVSKTTGTEQQGGYGNKVYSTYM